MTLQRLNTVLCQIAARVPACKAVLLWTISGLLLGVAGMAVAASATNKPAPLEVYIPKPESIGDTRSNYEVELLKLAFAKAKTPVVLRVAEQVRTQKQIVEDLKLPDARIRVAWFMSSAQRERELLPVRIPVDKGLLGWRISLVKAAKFNQFRNVRKVADLKPFAAVQQNGWPDVDILKSNTIRVVLADSYEQNFDMVAKELADYFPRSLIEYRGELDLRRGMGLIEEPSVVLRYPAASYFFLSHGQEAVAAKIASGLEAALSDGSFDRLFYRFHGQFIEGADLTRRRIIDLENSDFGERSVQLRREFWFR